MAGSVNKVILVGNLGRDPEIRFTQSGQKIANMSIATSETWRDKQSGERREKTEWHRVVVFDERLADIVEKYIKKGSKVYLEGALQTRKWTGNDGIEKYTTEVVLQRFSGVLTMLDSTAAAAVSTAAVMAEMMAAAVLLGMVLIMAAVGVAAVAVNPVVAVRQVVIWMTRYHSKAIIDC